MIHEKCGTEILAVHYQVDGKRKKYRGYCRTCKALASLKSESMSREETCAHHHGLALDCFLNLVKHQHAWARV